MSFFLILAMPGAGAVRRKMSHALGKMGELDVCLYIFPSLLDRLLGHLALRVGFSETLFYPLPDRRCQLVGERIDVAVTERPVGGRNRGINASGRFEPCEALAFAGAVNSDQRLEK